ncbi:MAG: hypothetical protein JRI23_04040 [Deltaproteobacteria bacterium]|nr:hypothetical protein [Deltaproteobacteria bacterium]MBW2530697.1 hypothetical protein [Deltaproteobacteria bacterium]
MAQHEGAPVVSDRWVTRQVAEAIRLMAPQGITIRKVAQRKLDPRFAALETPEDRDAVSAEVEPKVINVFIVRSLRDIHRTERFIMGVRWRLRRNLAKDYVILSTKALPTTLAHELGHYLGNPHSPVDNNIMSYQRSDPSAVRFDRAQGVRMRQIARRNLRIGRLIPADRYAELAAKPKP